jgi:peptide/nickel transport system ATP-binding protein
MVPHPFARPKGCNFHPRCESFMPGFCDRIDPPLVTLSKDADVRCLLFGGTDADQKESHGSQEEA